LKGESIIFKIIYGRTGSGKTHAIIQEIRNCLINDSHKKIILLTPEQDTFSYEYLFSTDQNLKGICSLQILSFERLAWHIFEELGNSAKVQLDDLGKLMLLRKIIAENTDQLPLTKNAIKKQGYLAAILNSLKDLKNADIDLLFLNQTFSFKDNEVFEKKLYEMAFIQAKFNHAIENSMWLDHADIYAILTEQLQKGFLNNIDVYIDGFDYFSPVQLKLVQAIIATAKNTTITFAYDNKEDNINFASIKKTYEQLKVFANAENILMHEYHLTEIKRFASEELQHLEQNYLSFQSDHFPKECHDIAIYECQNPEEEVENCANLILKLVRENKYRFNDIAVFVRHTEEYKSVVDRIFKEYQIPYFIDCKNIISTHPLSEMIDSAFEVINTNWSYASIFRYLKTGFIDTDFKNIDLLENYVLACGIKGSTWYCEEDWTWNSKGNAWDEHTKELWSSEQLKMLNSFRKKITKPLREFELSIKKAKTYNEMVQALYQLLQQYKIHLTLTVWRDDAIRQGQFLLAQAHQQMWETIGEILMQLKELGGDEPIEMDEFSLLMKTALSNVQLGMIPLGADQVFIGDPERSKNHISKVMIILGLNDGIFPARPNQNGIFTADELDILEPFGMMGMMQKLTLENKAAYIALTRASEKLYLSYMLSDMSGNACEISPIIEKIKELFPHISVKKNEPIQSANKLLSPTILKLLNNTADDLDKQYYNWYLKHSDYAPTMKQIFEIWLTDQPIQLKLEKPSELKLNISELEQYRTCPYSYYVKYMLRLKERNTYELAKFDIGQLYHKAMEDLTDTMMKENKDWDTIDNSQLDQMVKQTIKDLAPQMQNQILLSSGKYKYLTTKLEQTLHRSAFNMATQARQGSFKTAGIEVSFGDNGAYPALELTLSDGTILKLNGRIDRIEHAIGENCIYYRVVDLKSGNPKLTFDEIYYGLKIQLLTYLMIILNTHSNAKEAGILYYYIKNPITKGKRSDINTSVKMIPVNGILLAQTEPVLLADKNLAMQSKSEFLPIKLKNEGLEYINNPTATLSEEEERALFYATDPVITSTQFKELQKHLCNFIIQTGDHILQGDIQPYPYRYRDRNGCDYCKYNNICQFHIRPLSEYCELLPLGDREVLERIRKENSHGMDKGTTDSN